MASGSYAENVFINCPFDDQYVELRNALIFAVFDCGFIPRCALEVADSGEVRFDKIGKIISACRFGIHDISRTELDSETDMPRFNMPLELGVFLGTKRYGDSTQRSKRSLILDREQYRYQAFISDIAGNDIGAHQDDPKKAISHVRNWLNASSGRRTIPGGTAILERWQQLEDDLPDMCAQIPIDRDELTYNDYTNFISTWLLEAG